MAKVQCVSIFKTILKHQPGALLSVMQMLKSKGIGLTSIWGFGKASGDAEVHAMAKNPDKLRNALKAAGLVAEEYSALLVKGADRTGVLVKHLEVLAAAGINIEALQAIGVGGKFGTVIHIGAADVEKAAAALGAK